MEKRKPVNENLEFISSLSNSQKNKLYSIIVKAIFQVLKSQETEASKKNRKSRYMGDIIERKEFEIKTSKSGEKYYAY